MERILFMQLLHSKIAGLHAAQTDPGEYIPHGTGGKGRKGRCNRIAVGFLVGWNGSYSCSSSTGQAASHKACAADAPVDFSTDCIETTQEYLRIWHGGQRAQGVP